MKQKLSQLVEAGVGGDVLIAILNEKFGCDASRDNLWQVYRGLPEGSKEAQVDILYVFNVVMSVYPDASIYSIYLYLDVQDRETVLQVLLDIVESIMVDYQQCFPGDSRVIGAISKAQGTVDDIGEAVEILTDAIEYHCGDSVFENYVRYVYRTILNALEFARHTGSEGELRNMCHGVYENSLFAAYFYGKMRYLNTVYKGDVAALDYQDFQNSRNIKFLENKLIRG